MVIPSQEIKYLGFLINSRDMTVRLTDSKAHRLLSYVAEFRTCAKYAIRDVAALIRKLMEPVGAVAYMPHGVCKGDGASYRKQNL